MNNYTKTIFFILSLPISTNLMANFDSALKLAQEAWLDYRVEGTAKSSFTKLLQSWKEWPHDPLLNKSLAELAQEIYLNNPKDLYRNEENEQFGLDFIRGYDFMNIPYFRFRAHAYALKKSEISYVGVIAPGGYEFEIYPNGKENTSAYYQAENPSYKILLSSSKDYYGKLESGLYQLSIRRKDQSLKQYPLFFMVKPINTPVIDVTCSLKESLSKWKFEPTLLAGETRKSINLYFLNDKSPQVVATHEIKASPHHTEKQYRYNKKIKPSHVQLLFSETIIMESVRIHYSYEKKSLCL
jgi:hypothetical protein